MAVADMMVAGMVLELLVVVFGFGGSIGLVDRFYVL